MQNLINIVSQFDIDEAILDIQAFGNGHINTTYKVVSNNSNRNYLLQQINHQVFKDVAALQNNIQNINTHIRSKLEMRGDTDIHRKSMELIPTRDAKLYYFDNQNYWRMMVLIPDALSYEAVTPEYSFAAGKAFAEFQMMLADMPEGALVETIPNFHNMEFRLQQFDDAIAHDPVGRVAEISDIIAEINQRRSEMLIIGQLHKAGELPKRINHCDTKVNNMLFDADGNVLCIIDLDTTMPGFVVSDFGDFMRTAGNKGLEDDEDLDRVAFDMQIFEAYTKGYVGVAKNFLTAIELQLLPFGARLMTYMQLCRFITDYINGDTYYKIHSPQHNLQRSKAQLKLLQSIESKMPDMQQFIAALC